MIRKRRNRKVKINPKKNKRQQRQQRQLRYQQVNLSKLS